MLKVHAYLKVLYVTLPTNSSSSSVMPKAARASGLGAGGACGAGALPHHLREQVLKRTGCADQDADNQVRRTTDLICKHTPLSSR